MTYIARYTRVIPAIYATIYVQCMSTNIRELYLSIYLWAHRWCSHKMYTNRIYTCTWRKIYPRNSAKHLPKKRLSYKTSTQGTIMLQNICPRNDYATKHLPKERLCYKTSAQGTIMLHNICPRNDYATKHLPKEQLCYKTSAQGLIMLQNICPRNDYATKHLPKEQYTTSIQGTLR